VPKTQSTQVVVIGGGPVGATVSTLLAHALQKKELLNSIDSDARAYEIADCTPKTASIKTWIQRRF
jgi:threonine dehydrogenase-like Zn-dependent dehydrogenase